MDIEIVKVVTFNNANPEITVPAGLVNSALILLPGTHQVNVTGAQWNGDAFTFIDSGSSAFDENGDIWMLLNPDPATNVFNIDLDGGAWTGGTVLLVQNVKQTTTLTKNNGAGSSSSASVAVVPPNGNVLIVASCGSEANETSTLPASAVLKEVQGQSFENAMACYYVTKTGERQVPTFTLSSGQRWGMAVACIEGITPEANKPGNIGKKLRVGNGVSVSDNIT